MSTVCKMLIATNAVDQFEQLLLQHVREVHGTAAFDISDSEWPLLFDSPFNCSELEPTAYAWQQRPAVLEVFFNSFSTQTGFAETLSTALKSAVIVSQYQSTAEAGYWGYITDGRLVRSIEYGDGEIVCEFGDLLPFELDRPGCDAGTGDGEWQGFGVDDLDHYTHAVGFAIDLNEEMLPNWRNLAAPSPQPVAVSVSAKPWWKFW